MYREKIEDLLTWKKLKDRSPLIIRGARQVGKTWLMKEFGNKYYKNVAYINFDNNEKMKNLFELDYDIERIIQGLKIESNIDIEVENTLIIFDEVQEVPKALSSLKYFNENANEYHIIAAGSLLGVGLHEGTSFPVGKVEFLDLYPLNFYEFLLAIGKEQIANIIRKNEWNLIESFATNIIVLLKEYYYIGGMPAVINKYIETKSYDGVRAVQIKILSAYQQDFSKHAPNDIVPRIQMLWNNIPTQLAKENKKFIYGLVREGARAKEYEMAIAWLIDAGLVYKVNRVNKPNFPLNAYQDFSAFKLYILDVGLLSAMTNLSKEILLEGSDIFTEFKGSFAEQYVLTELKSSSNNAIFYWSAENATAEIDYIIQYENKIVPVEVKAETNLKAKSLKQFIGRYKTSINVRTSMANYLKQENVINIPLYSIANFEKILAFLNN